MRRRWIVLPGLVAAAATALGVSFASAGTSAQNATVKVFMSERVAVNRYFQEGMRFSPGTVTVASGGTLTFEYGDKEMDPHTLTIVSRADLPKTVAQVENCRACQRYATPHLKNPKAEPGPANPIVHWTLNTGQPGLDTVGDSLAIQPGAHRKISAKVTAPAGTTLYFICAVHPWMQGRIVVT